MNVDIPAPTGGWNARDDFAAMDLTDAIDLKNIVPENGYCRSRGGSKYFYERSKEFTNEGEINTLVVFDNGIDNLLISCSGNSIYNATDATAPVELKSNQGSDYYDTMMFKRRLIMCNGVDTPQIYEGHLETIDMVATLEDSNGEVSGKTIANIIGCNQYKGRAFYWLDKEQRFFYADFAGAFQGLLKEFDLSQQVKKGGAIESIFTFARDTGSGLDDYLVVMFNTGECLLYQGDDPGSSENWSLVQRHNIGKLVNNRSVCQKGGDNLLITSEGLVNFSLAIQGLPAQHENHTGSKIVNAFTRSFKLHQYKDNWEINYFPEFNFIIANVPYRPSDIFSLADTEFRQFILNTSTGAWCKFTDLNATTWTVFNGMLLFGDVHGNIIQAEKGTNDLGNYITCKAITAFSAFEQMGKWKKCTGAGITCNFPYKKQIGIKILKDFDQTKRLILPYPSDPLPVDEFVSDWDIAIWDVDTWDDIDPDASAIWDTAIWDVDKWYIKNKVFEFEHILNKEKLDFTRTLFYPAIGKGYVLAIKLKLHTRATEFQWYNSIMRLKLGGRK